MKVVHKTGKFLGNKIADAVAKSNGDQNVKPKTCNWWKSKK